MFNTDLSLPPCVNMLTNLFKLIQLKFEILHLNKLPINENVDTQLYVYTGVNK